MKRKSLNLQTPEDIILVKVMQVRFIVAVNQIKVILLKTNVHYFSFNFNQTLYTKYRIWFNRRLNNKQINIQQQAVKKNYGNNLIVRHRLYTC